MKNGTTFSAKALEFKDMLDKMKPGKPVAVCRHCGRVLTHPTSVAAGIGPECAGKEGQGE